LWEQLFLCDDLVDRVTYIRSYGGWYISVSDEFGTGNRTLRAESVSTANAARFEWLGSYRAGESTFRLKIDGALVTMKNHIAGEPSGMLRALSGPRTSEETFEVRLVVPADGGPRVGGWSSDPRVREELANVVKRAPGAEMIDKTSVQMEPGLILRVMTPYKEDLTFEVLARLCPFGSLCLYEQARWNSGGSIDGRPLYMLQFTGCKYEWELGHIPYPGGGDWHDRVSSTINHQHEGERSYFYNHAKNNIYERVWEMGSPTLLGDLELDKVGEGTLNDMIDGVHVCGPEPASPWTPTR